MKLACPKCHLSLRVQDQKVPEVGAWAKCPRCQERFFINPAGHSIEDLTRPAAEEPSTRPSRPGQRDRTSQELLDRLKAKQGRTDEPDYTPELITVYPEPAVPEYAYRAISAVMLCLPLVAVLVLFNSTNDRLKNAAPRPEPTATVVERLNDQENPDFIRRDLLNIKREHLRRKRGYYEVAYRGPESRAFKYFMSRLAPGVCSEISRLQVTTQGLSNQADFTVTAICLEPEGRRLEMIVQWIDRGGRITFPYNKQSEDFPLYPPAPDRPVDQPVARSAEQPVIRPAVQANSPEPPAATTVAAPPRRPLVIETAN